LDFVNSAAQFLAIVIGVCVVASVLSEAFRWYIEIMAPRTASKLDNRLLPIVRRIAVGLLYALGALLVMDQLGINISPLIAGLGLGGLAVALALQPTLANLFAGTYVMTEGVVTPGDYIQLENGVAGYVMDVSWRSTRLRTWHNNLVVVPNARFAETIITNYQEPVPAVNVFLTCGVSYDSDLRQVQQVSQEVMDELLENDANAVKEYGGWFGFDSFGESNVNFWLFVQARNRLASFELQTSLMQNLHQRLNEEGIVINYPVRTLQFPREWAPPDGMVLGGTPARLRRGNGRHPPRRKPKPRRQPRPDIHIFPETSSDSGGDGPGPCDQPVDDLRLRLPHGRRGLLQRRAQPHRGHASHS
jgi:small-conductance mechanosensitive channel